MDNNINLVILNKQLNDWIENCELQAGEFSECGMEIPEVSALAMALAYKNVKYYMESGIWDIDAKCSCTPDETTGHITFKMCNSCGKEVVE